MTAIRKSLSRADSVRSRRAKDIKQRVVIAADTLSKPGRYTPIVTRGEVDSVPIFTQARKKTKRKFYISLFGGSELKLPALPVFRPGWRLASAALFILAALGLYAIWYTPFFRVTTVTVKGGDRVTPEQVMNIAPLKGQRMLTIIPAQIASVVRNSFPVLVDVKVTTGIPASITIHLKEREPVMIWEQDGMTQWISADGVAFEPYGESRDLISVHASGNPPTGKTNLTLAKPDPVKSLASIIFKSEKESSAEVLPVVEPKSFIDPALIPPIKAIAVQVPEGVKLNYHPRYGLGWQDPGGWMVYFGMNPDDMPAKLNKYRNITAKLTAQGITPRIISMENLYAPYYRTE